MAMSTVQVVFPQGVAWRKSPSYNDRITHIRGPAQMNQLWGTIVQGDVQYVQVNLPPGSQYPVLFLPLTAENGTELCRLISQPPQSAQPQQLQEAIALFDAIDNNGDGVLEMAEMMARLSDFGMEEDTIEAIFFRLDTNQDNLIQREEWLQGYSYVTKKTQKAKLSTVRSPSASAADDDDDDAGLSVFLSMRFPDGKPLPIGNAIRQRLEARGVEVTPSLVPGAQNRYTEIAKAIERCDVFVVFGTEDYGVDTGNQMSSNKEFQFAKGEGRKVLHIKMCHKIEEAEIRMGLQNYIWKDQNEGVDALTDWIIACVSADNDHKEDKEEWTEHWDEEQERPYWYNAATEESVWEKPESVGNSGEDESVGNSGEDEWTEQWDEEQERPYWYNQVTEEWVWERPSGH